MYGVKPPAQLLWIPYPQRLIIHLLKSTCTVFLHKYPLLSVTKIYPVISIKHHKRYYSFSTLFGWIEVSVQIRAISPYEICLQSVNGKEQLKSKYSSIVIPSGKQI